MEIPITKPAQTLVASDAPVKASFPTEQIDLPSDGHFYSEGSPLSSGRIELKYMTAKEEDILTSQNLIKKGVVLDELLKALIVNPLIKLDDILIGDKNAIFVAARRLAYGNSYPVKIKCEECGEDSEVQIDLSTLTNKEFDFTKYSKGQNQFDFQLPFSKRNVVYKLLTHRDEQAIDAELKAISKINKGLGSTPEMTTRLKYMLLSVDGKDDRGFIKKFVDTELTSRDSLELRNHIKGNNPDMDMTFDFVCPKCGHPARMAMPLGVDFFWPSK
jgi:rRNA maturation protein Nop10